jgi:hypothetical protein
MLVIRKITVLNWRIAASPRFCSAVKSPLHEGIAGLHG